MEMIVSSRDKQNNNRTNKRRELAIQQTAFMKHLIESNEYNSRRNSSRNEYSLPTLPLPLSGGTPDILLRLE